MKAKARSRRASANPELTSGWRFTALLSAVLLSLLPLHASAKKADRQQNMNYEAKTTNAYNQPNTITTLTGAVKITQGTLLLTGDLAKIYLDGDTQISHIVVTGNPAHIQQLDENNNLMTGDAAQLDYDSVNGIAVLTTNAAVHQQCRGEFHGDKLTYNTNTSLITGESGGDGLVHGVMLPKDNPAAPVAAPVSCAKPPTAQPVPDSEPVAGKLPIKPAAKPGKSK
ncbi:MAG TPA: lipopolysaccharide transport periplasmic protein LptA [Rhodanobacter sp.]